MQSLCGSVVVYLSKAFLRDEALRNFHSPTFMAKPKRNFFYFNIRGKNTSTFVFDLIYWQIYFQEKCIKYNKKKKCSLFDFKFKIVLVIPSFSLLDGTENMGGICSNVELRNGGGGGCYNFCAIYLKKWGETLETLD